MRRRTSSSLALVATGLVTALAGTASAQAAPAFTCEASALRGTILGQATIEPSVYGRGQECKTGQAVPTVKIPELLDASVLVASGNRTDDAAKPSASAAGGLAGATVKLLPSVPLTLPVDQVAAAIPAQTVPLGALGLLLGLPGGNLTVDVGAAIKRLAAPLPQADLLSAGVLSSVAAASCDGTAATPKLAGTSTITGLKVLGQNVAVDSTLQQNLNVVDTASIDPSNLTISQLNLGLPVLDQLNLGVLQAALQPVLDALPTITIPPTVVQVKVGANIQTKDASSLTQQALTVKATLLGQPLLDVVIGEAKVGATGDCPKVTGSGGPAELQCTDRKLVLLDVFKEKGRVRLRGAANQDFVGKTVDIKYRAQGNKVVAKAKVAADGSFTTTAAMPPSSISDTNLSRYTAVRGDERSLPLKLIRRMRTSSVSSKSGNVTIRGQVSLPLASPVQSIRLIRRVSCGKAQLIKTFKPKSNGSFSVTVKASSKPAVYRAVTAVRKVTTNPKTYPTFTLPRGIDLSAR